MRVILIFGNRTGFVGKMDPFMIDAGFEMVCTSEPGEIEVIYEKKDVVTVVLDIEISRTGFSEGIELIAKLREKIQVPLLVTSDQTAATAKIIALNTGADDFIEAKSNPLEVIARINAQLRRYKIKTKRMPEKNHIYKLRDLVVDDLRHSVTLAGKNVKLTVTEYKILLLLMQHIGSPFTAAEIYESVWGMKAVGSENMIAVHIRHIREKIEEDPRDPQYLKSVWGRGYKVE